MVECANKCDFLVWAYREQCVHFILPEILLTRGSKCTNHGKNNLNCMFPEKSSDFVVFFVHVHFLVLILRLVDFVWSTE